MARIRTIKPEFPQSESMGRVSRDARLLFVEMWTLADDAGRLRGNSRMLASLLFPYDNDAPGLIDDWLSELEREGCIVRYLASGLSYIEIRNWLIHQKIDKPSKSKIPSFDESSRILANPRESSSGDQGSRIKDQGEEKEAQSADPAGSSPPEPDGLGIPAPLAPPDDSSAGRPRAADVDPVKAIFDLGIPILTAADHTERAARSLIGRLRKLKGDEQAASILVAAKSKTDPATYIAAATLPEKRRVQLC